MIMYVTNVPGTGTQCIAPILVVACFSTFEVFNDAFEWGIEQVLHC